MSEEPTTGSRIDRRSYLSGSAALGLLSLGAGSGRADDGTSRDGGGRTVTEIDECTAITDPGRYALTTDLRADPGDHCLEIRASNVTLEGRGHAITGRKPADPVDFPFDSGSTGVLVRPPRSAPGDGKKSKPDAERAVANVELTDLTVEGFTTGVGAFRTRNGRFEGLEVRHNDYGIGLFESVGNRLASNRAAENAAAGYYLSDSRANLLRRNEASENAGDPANETDGHGFWLDRLAVGSSRNLLVENDATANRIGFRLTGSDENVLKKNDADENGQLPGDAGIFLEDARENTLAGNSANATLDGIALEDSRENTLERNVANENSFEGIVLGRSHENTLRENVTRSNFDVGGIVLLESHGNTLEENVAAENTISGITLVGSHRNALAENATTETESTLDAGLFLADSHDNRISAHVSTDNDGYGYRLRDANLNTGRNNAAGGNDRGPFEIEGGYGNRIEIDGVWYPTDDADGPTAEREAVPLSESLQAILTADDPLQGLREYQATAGE